MASRLGRKRELDKLAISVCGSVLYLLGLRAAVRSYLAWPWLTTPKQATA